MNEKLEFMYDHMDYDNDREQVRQKFLNEANKRVTLEDIGETLDKLIYESKAEHATTYDLVEDYNSYPRHAKKEYTSDQFNWTKKLLSSMDPKSPAFFDDPD